MGLTNAQVALLAAAKSPYGGDVAVTDLAADYLGWLDAQDKPEPTKPVRLCNSLSTGNSRCTLEAEHGGRHHNDRHGTAWADAPVVIDKPVKVTPVGTHFRPSEHAKHITCGPEYDENLYRTTGFVRDVTCKDCKEELGL